MLTKQSFTSLILLLLLTVSCNQSIKESKNSKISQEQQENTRSVINRKSIDFVEHLKLSSEQALSFNAVRDKYKQQMMQLSNEDHTDKQSLTEAIQQMRKEQFAEINQILSSEQFVQYKELIKANSENN